MKTDIFNSAILSRKKLRFLYNLNHVEMEPYFLAINKNGEKVIYGRVNNSHNIKMFEFNKIFNIKVLEQTKFSPIIPILPILN
ncbi:MAG: hypothetical protein KDC88_12600 [Ignavibacteriae bacterium]|nr:hypothetical protein [Ignavibacteriota bacterium]MCB9210081.1 hypothetical protein [Ignavibacteriales bacterium]MCB9218534.1 hypothetical protein [Ignavibacteriales bacterium]MCB9259460.1 hypothetical protein [Ignavibacteriales bacterium]